MLRFKTSREKGPAMKVITAGNVNRPSPDVADHIRKALIELMLASDNLDTFLDLLPVDADLTDAKDLSQRINSFKESIRDQVGQLQAEANQVIVDIENKYCHDYEPDCD